MAYDAAKEETKEASELVGVKMEIKNRLCAIMREAGTRGEVFKPSPDTQPHASRLHRLAHRLIQSSDDFLELAQEYSQSQLYFV